jgi:hypothetical protein
MLMLHCMIVCGVSFHFNFFYFSILYSDGKNIMNLMNIMKHKASSFMDKLHVRTIIWK